jgi:hypothetical protein
MLVVFKTGIVVGREGMWSAAGRLKIKNNLSCAACYRSHSSESKERGREKK